MAQDNQNFIPVTPDLNTWIRLMFKSLSANINCHTLGTIHTFDPVTQTATIAINYVRAFPGANPNLPNPAPDGQTSTVYTEYPILIQCPVVIMQGGGAHLTFPIKGDVYNTDGSLKTPGDSCIVIFNDREITTWLTTGQKTFPQNARVHDLSDGIALIGIRSIQTGNPIANYNTEVVSLSDETGERLLQSGMMMAYGGASSPSGWLLCQGQAISRSTYNLLFSVIGTTYGVGNGTTTFNVPDMRGQVAVGLKSGDPYFGNLGDEYGQETIPITDSNLPADITFMDHTGTAYDYILMQDPSGVTVKDVIGGGVNLNIIQPSLVVNWIIKI